ncbi:MAG TPA: hypothetical protein VLM80_05665 [Anaerolineales bacterium]|nr:hypothetical protein [Anaerolineales bacterium]
MIRKLITINTASGTNLKSRWFSCMKISLAAALLLALIGIVSVSAASSLFHIEWWVFTGGGGRIGADDIQLESSLGEPITGHSMGGDISLDSGSWTEVLEPQRLFLPVIVK